MKTTRILALAAALAGLAATPSRAEENWTPRLPGVTEGLAAGALPPEGLYFINTTLLAPFSASDKNGQGNGVSADVFVEVPMVLWNTGIKVLGADWGVALAQPITRVAASGGGLDEQAWGLFSTIVTPANLSWALPAGFHVAAGLSVYIPDGTAQRTVISYRNGSYKGVPNSSNYWALEPTFGLSWLKDGWNASINMAYDVNFKNTDSGYTSGNALVVDYTLTKSLGAWTVGVGGYSVNQLEDDKSEHAVIQAGIDSSDGNRQTKYGAGPIVGYDFGKATLTGYYNHGFGQKNVLSGDTFWTRLVVPF